MKTKKRLLVFALVIVIVAGVVCGVLYIRNTQWEKDISISGGEWVANGYQNASASGGNMFDVGEKGNPYYDYKITNKTNHSMSDVVIVFECEGKGIDSKKWTYKYRVGYLLPGETKSIKVYHWDMFETPDKYWSTDFDIKKVTYKK